MVQKALTFSKRHASEAIIMFLLTTLIGIYAHALTEQAKIRVRVSRVEEGNATALEAVAGLYENSQLRTESLRRELDQRTTGMEKQIIAAVDKIESRCFSMERLIATLLDVIKKNGLGLNDADLNLQEG